MEDEAVETAINDWNYCRCVVFGFCMLGGPWYHGLVLLMALIGYYEFVK